MASTTKLMAGFRFCRNASMFVIVALASAVLVIVAHAEPAVVEPGAEPLLQPEPGSAVEAAVADLSERLEIQPEAVTVVTVDEVTWRDSSIGCPEPDRAYLQVLTPGLRIVLAVGESSYEYHSGRGGRVIFCANPQPPVM